MASSKDIKEGATIPGTSDGGQGSNAPQDSGTNLRKTVPYAKEDGTVGQKDVPQPEGPQVKYIGPATRRVLTPEDWERVGVDDTEHETYEWNLKNAKMIPRDQFSEKQLAYLRTDDRFSVEGD
jgi:hypothetical protein